MQIVASRPHRLRMTAAVIDAISPIDGRYSEATEPLRPILSEAGLIRERIRIEAQWLLHLAQAAPGLPGSSLAPGVAETARALAGEPPAEAAEWVKRTEARINHDVKA